MDSVQSVQNFVKSRVYDAPKDHVSASELINAAAFTDWQQVEKCTCVFPGASTKRNSSVEAATSRFASSFWAYLSPEENDGIHTEKTHTSSPFSQYNKRSCKLTCQSARVANIPPDTPSVTSMSQELDRLFGQGNPKSHLFKFEQESALPRPHNVLHQHSMSDQGLLNSPYSMTVLEECDHFASSDENSILSDATDTGSLLDGSPDDPECHPMQSLRRKCDQFFEHHGLVVKVRKLPAESHHPKLLSSSKPVLCYPSYHFVMRLYNHIVEQLLRSKTFVDSVYNNCSDPLNANSPFSLIDLTPDVLYQLYALKNEIRTSGFSGIFISLSTKAFVSQSDFGPVRRTKTIGWVLIELLDCNERRLRGAWIHPSISPQATTSILSALLPYSIMTSFMVSPRDVKPLYPLKTFCVSLKQFDIFPRAALALLTSPHRFGLTKHFDVLDHLPQGPNCQALTKLSHFDNGVTTERCFCHTNLEPSDLERVIVCCTEALMVQMLPRWLKLVPEDPMPSLLDDLEAIVKPDFVAYNAVKTLDSPEHVRDAECAGLSDTDIRDLLLHLYGCQWKTRLKPRVIDSLKEPVVLPKPCSGEPFVVYDPREERRKRRSRVLGHA
ncbi:erythrocyte membrane related protein, putative [Babesia ovis]|uniref:Erythrocyte membrane related protein, putative n=1 Tax=Babesia ovis TaxID=5869 RepID=A0A9W5TC82_BABOV|nr:erythrocyte membrane related protein, putative [Babesia ovis]